MTIGEIMGISVGDVVVFKGSVISRLKHSEFAVTFIGEVVGVYGGTCDVDTLDGIRSVPVANLAKKAKVYDWRLQRSVEFIVDPDQRSSVL